MPEEPFDASEDVVDEASLADAEAASTRTIERYAISSYGADYPVDSLYRRLTSDSEDANPNIYIPDFQRGWVWTRPQAERFIESLLLGLPVPGIFLSRDERTQKLLVIDGGQRLRTIKFFYDGIIGGREFTLAKVHEDFIGKAYKSLEPEDRRRLDDSIIHATVVHQERPEGSSSAYYLFERINTGGTPAQPHEIRRALFTGSFDQLLSHLDKDEVWRSVYGNPSKRMKDQELILRFLALRSNWSSYSGTMKDFLNRFMDINRSLSAEQEKDYSSAFLEAIHFITDQLETRPFRPGRSLNTAVFDAVMVGVAERLAARPITDAAAFRSAYSALLAAEDFTSATSTGTSQEANVKKRLGQAIEAFEHIE